MSSLFEIKYLMRNSTHRFIVEVKLTDPTLSSCPKGLLYSWVWIENESLSPLTFVKSKQVGKLQSRVFEQGQLEFSSTIATYEVPNQEVMYMVCEEPSKVPYFVEKLLEDFVTTKTEQARHWLEQEGSKIVNELTIEPAPQESLANAGAGILIVDDAADKRNALKINSFLAAASVASGVSMDLESLIPKKYLRPAKHYNPKFDAKKADEQKAWNELRDQERKALKDYKKSVPRSERVFSKKK